MPIPEELVDELVTVARRMGISHYELIAQLLYVYVRSSSFSGDLVGVALEAAILSYLKRYGLVTVPITALRSINGDGVQVLASRIRDVARVSTLALAEQGVIRDETTVRSIFSSWLPGLPLNVTKVNGDEWRVVVASPEIEGAALEITASIIRGIIEGLRGRLVELKSESGVVSARFILPGKRR